MIAWRQLRNNWKNAKINENSAIFAVRGVKMPLFL